MKLSTINIKKGKKVVMPFGIKMIGTAASFAFSILLGRLLGPDGVGVYSVANNLLTISLIIVKFGLDIALIKHISIYFHKKHSGDARRAMHDSALLCLALSSALILFFEVTATLFAKLFNMDGSLDQLLRFMIVAIAPTGLLHLLSSFFKGVRSTKTGLFFESALIPLASCSFLLLAGVLWDELNF